MRWDTHMLFAVNSLWLLTIVPDGVDFSTIGLLAAAAIFGGLLPDLDAAESKIKHLQVTGIKPFLIPAQVVHRTDVHRGILHSLIGLGFVATVSVPMAILMGWTMWLALLLGYASHLFADAATKTGIRLLYPRQQRSYLLPKQWRITTGSLAEEMLLSLLIVGAMTLLLSNLLSITGIDSTPAAEMKLHRNLMQFLSKSNPVF